MNNTLRIFLIWFAIGWVLAFVIVGVFFIASMDESASQDPQNIRHLDDGQWF